MEQDQDNMLKQRRQAIFDACFPYALIDELSDSLQALISSYLSYVDDKNCILPSFDEVKEGLISQLKQQVVLDLCIRPNVSLDSLSKEQKIVLSDHECEVDALLTVKPSFNHSKRAIVRSQLQQQALLDECIPGAVITTLKYFLRQLIENYAHYIDANVEDVQSLKDELKAKLAIEQCLQDIEDNVYSIEVKRFNDQIKTCKTKRYDLQGKLISILDNEKKSPKTRYDDFKSEVERLLPQYHDFFWDKGGLFLGKSPFGLNKGSRLRQALSQIQPQLNKKVLVCTSDEGFASSDSIDFDGTLNKINEYGKQQQWQAVVDGFAFCLSHVDTLNMLQLKSLLHELSSSSELTAHINDDLKYHWLQMIKRSMVRTVLEKQSDEYGNISQITFEFEQMLVALHLGLDIDADEMIIEQAFAELPQFHPSEVKNTAKNKHKQEDENEQKQAFARKLNDGEYKTAMNKLAFFERLKLTTMKQVKFQGDEQLRKLLAYEFSRLLSLEFYNPACDNKSLWTGPYGQVSVNLDRAKDILGITQSIRCPLIGDSKTRYEEDLDPENMVGMLGVWPHGKTLAIQVHRLMFACQSDDYETILTAAVDAKTVFKKQPKMHCLLEQRLEKYWQRCEKWQWTGIERIGFIDRKDLVKKILSRVVVKKTQEIVGETAEIFEEKPNNNYQLAARLVEEKRQLLAVFTTLCDCQSNLSMGSCPYSNKAISQLLDTRLPQAKLFEPLRSWVENHHKSWLESFELSLDTVKRLQQILSDIMQQRFDKTIEISNKIEQCAKNILSQGKPWRIINKQEVRLQTFGVSTHRFAVNDDDRTGLEKDPLASDRQSFQCE